MSDLLAGARSPELSGGPMLLVPVGSTEQHGPHLPLGMDTVIADDFVTIDEICTGDTADTDFCKENG